MSQPNADFIQSVYDAFRRGDIQFIMDRMTDDVDWSFEGPASVPYCGRRRGKKEVAGFFEALATTQSNHTLTMDHVFEHGNMVAGFGRYGAKVTATGKSFDSPIAHYFEVRDGKISKFIDYGDTAVMAASYSK